MTLPKPSFQIDGPGGPYLGYVVQPGWVLWHHDKPGGVAVLMPEPRRDWPESLQQAYEARLLTATTGRCPLCATDMEYQPTAPREGKATYRHDDGCPAVSRALMAYWDDANRAAMGDGR